MNRLARSGFVAPTWKSVRSIGILIVLLPIATFYGLLVDRLLNIPYWDDYDAALSFVEHLAHVQTLSGMLRDLLFWQHNEYRLVFENCVLVLQTEISSHIDFAILSLIGDAFVLPIVYLLWRDFLPAEGDNWKRLRFFIPVPFLLCQLNYAETLNWTVAALQNLPVVAFALACIGTLCRPQRYSLPIACGYFVLAVASSGNGFFLWPIGLLILFQARRLAGAALWAMLGIITAIIYFYHYQFASSRLISSTSELYRHSYLKPLFTISFIGSAVGFDYPIIRYISVLAGAGLCAAVFLMVKKQYWKTNPALSYFVLFIFLTALGVTVTRSSIGYGASLASRYRIYSDLLLICVYEFACRSSLKAKSHHREAVFGTVLCAAIAFCVGCDVYGFKYLEGRNSRLVEGVRLYEKSGGALGPAIPVAKDDEQVAAVNNVRFRQIMHEAEGQGLYSFPKR